VQRTLAFFFVGLRRRQRNFPEDCEGGFDPNHPPVKRSPDNGFTVLSRNDARFALILSETARKIGPFAGPVLQRSLNALNDRRNLPPAGVIGDSIPSRVRSGCKRALS
jgi:hypothetical protein